MLDPGWGRMPSTDRKRRNHPVFELLRCACATVAIPQIRGQVVLAVQQDDQR
jgi:hypothetical protein